MTSVLINVSRSADVSRAGPLSTAIPDEFSGGKRKGFEKSRSRVTKARPSEAQRVASSSSVEEVSYWIATVQTSCPSATRRSSPRVPRFCIHLLPQVSPKGPPLAATTQPSQDIVSSSISFTPPVLVQRERSARGTWRLRMQCRPEYPQESGQDRLPGFPEWNLHLPENQESGKPRFGARGCTAFRHNGPDRSRSALG